MAKKILAICAALVACAAIPALVLASNSPELVQGGAPVEVGKNLQATHTETARMTNGSEETLVSCSTAAMTGKLTKNDGSNIEASITAASFKDPGSDECSGTLGATEVEPVPAANGLPWCIRSTTTMATHEFQVRGNSCNLTSRPIRFAIEITSPGITCNYERTTAVPGKYTTSGTETILSISKVEFPALAGNPAGCPANGFLDMKFSIEIDGTGMKLGIQ